MNCRTKSLLVSLVIHAGAICLVMTMSGSWAPKSRDIVIDLTLPESGVSGSADSEREKRSHGPKHRKPKEKPQRPVKAPEALLINRHPPVPGNPAPVAPAEATGTVALVAPPFEKTAGRTGGEGQGAGPASGFSRSGSSAGPGRSGGEGTSPGQMKNRYIREQYEYIKGLIQKSLVYPKRARRMGWTGRVLVSFDILEDGHVAGERILNSSGHALLDDNVIETIRNVAPFPRPPGRAKLEISFTFELH